MTWQAAGRRKKSLKSGSHKQDIQNRATRLWYKSRRPQKNRLDPNLVPKKKKKPQKTDKVLFWADQECNKRLVRVGPTLKIGWSTRWMDGALKNG